MRKFIIAAAAALALGTNAMAAEHLVDQKNLSFSQAEITIAAGDTIKFTNGDRTSHHVWTKDNGVDFSSRMLRPGESYQMKFDKPGTYKVQCHIHPKMKMTVVVK
jgi:plastocyanin